jgi:hypothetical protein
MRITPNEERGERHTPRAAERRAAPAVVAQVVPVSSGPREALRQAHEARRWAEGEVVRRREVLECVRQRLSAMETELDAAAKRVARLARVLALAHAFGHEVAEPASLSDVGRSRRHRDEAQGAMNQAQAAMAFIEQGVQEAETALGKSQRDVLEAAEAVIIERGFEIADRLAEIDAERDALRRKLDGLDRVWITIPGVSVPRLVQLPERVERAFGGVISASAGSWAACLAALQTDPEAELP